jgi:AcrR family transcriptional regulator
MARLESPSPQRKRDTGAQLVAAAIREFSEHGFHGTDSNKIARRAGFSPQTFYRWFKDKSDIFIAAYQSWQEEEKSTLDTLIAAGAPTARSVDAIIKHHRDHLLFRRSLRQISLEDANVRQARAESRLRQTQRILDWKGLPAGKRNAVFITLLQLERLADAAAEGELEDAGISPSGLKSVMAEMLNNP